MARRCLSASRSSQREKNTAQDRNQFVFHFIIRALVLSTSSVSRYRIAKSSRQIEQAISSLHDFSFVYQSRVTLTRNWRSGSDRALPFAFNRGFAQVRRRRAFQA